MTPPVDGAGLTDVVTTYTALYITDATRRQQWAMPLTTQGAPADLPRRVQR